MDSNTYKRKRASLLEEEQRCVEQLRAKKTEYINRHKTELDVIQKLYENKKEEFEKKVQKATDDYYEQKFKIQKVYDEKLRDLNKDSELAAIYEDKMPMSWEQSLDMLLQEAARNAGHREEKRDIARVYVNTIFKAPEKLRDNQRVVAEYYGNTCPSNALATSHMDLPMRRLLYRIVQHVTACIDVQKKQIFQYFNEGKDVEVEFHQAKDQCKEKKMVYKTQGDKFFTIYFNYIFENSISRKILREMISTEARMRLVSTTVHSVILAPL